MEYLGWAAVLLVGYLVGRNRNIQKAYQELISDLHEEIDRLRERIKELEALLSGRSRK